MLTLTLTRTRTLTLTLTRADYVKGQFKLPWTYDELFMSENKVVFGDYMRMGVPREDRRYEANPSPQPWPEPEP